MVPAGTSNELDVQNKWEENTHTHTRCQTFYLMFFGYTAQQGIPYGTKATRLGTKLNSKSDRWTSLIGQRPLLPCRVGKQPGCTSLWLLFSKPVPCVLVLYPELSGNETLPSAISSPRNHFPLTSKGPNILIVRLPDHTTLAEPASSPTQQKSPNNSPKSREATPPSNPKQHGRQKESSTKSPNQSWNFVDVPLIFCCPAGHVLDWQPRILLGMVEARSVNVKKTTTTEQ